MKETREVSAPTGRPVPGARGDGCTKRQVTVAYPEGSDGSKGTSPARGGRRQHPGRRARSEEGFLAKPEETARKSVTHSRTASARAWCLRQQPSPGSFVVTGLGCVLWLKQLLSCGEVRGTFPGTRDLDMPLPPNNSHGSRGWAFKTPRRERT